MAHFEHASLLPTTPEELYDWHVRPGALTRLSPPWQTVQRLSPEESLHEEQRVRLRIFMGPVPVPWVARHRDLQRPLGFTDDQVVGPFASWVHTHRFEPAPEGARLRDRLEYRFRGGAPAERVGDRFLQPMLRRMFRYRHDVTAQDLQRHARWADRPRLKVAVTGATGLIGRQLCALLTTGGHEVLKFTRKPKGSDEAGWDPRQGTLDAGALAGVDAVVHLAGETIAGRWTLQKKHEIMRSRTAGTGLLARALTAVSNGPRTLVSSSAIGYYGDRGAEPLTEDSPPGKGFLADVCREWEAATAPASQAGVRTVLVRTGVVLSPAGGALKAMLPAFLAGVGGPVGNGRQYWSWISLDDLIGVLYHALMDEGLQGPVNGVAGAATSRDFARTLGRVLGRPAFLPLPAMAVRMLMGEMGQALLLDGANVVPQRLTQGEFRFMQPTLDAALRHELGR